MSIELGKFAMLVAFGDVGGGEQGLGALLQFAIAAGDTTVGTGRDRAPAGAFALGTDFRGDFHVLTLHLERTFRKWKKLCGGVEGIGKAATDWRGSENRNHRGHGGAQRKSAITIWFCELPRSRKVPRRRRL